MFSEKIFILILAISGAHAWLWGENKNEKKPWEYNDNMGLSDKKRLWNLTAELIVDAAYKIRQSLFIREHHSRSLAYDVGHIMGTVRERYREMMGTYREWQHKFEKRSTIYGPGIRTPTTVHYIMAMEVVHTIELEIDRLIDVMENIPEEELEDHRGNTRKRRKIGNRRSNDAEKIKHQYRERHLMRKMGLALNGTTTKKRFLNNWPVEDTWNFGPYDDIGMGYAVKV